MHGKNSGKVLRDNKTFLSLMRQGRIKYNVTNIRPFCLKYYKHYVRNTNTPCDELSGIHFVIWDVLAFHYPIYISYKIQRITYAYDTVSVA